MLISLEKKGDSACIQVSNCIKSDFGLRASLRKKGDYYSGD